MNPYGDLARLNLSVAQVFFITPTTRQRYLRSVRETLECLAQVCNKFFALPCLERRNQSMDLFCCEANQLEKK